jgi:hypothetical protein
MVCSFDWRAGSTGFVLYHAWIGTLGAVTITFVIFYVTLKYTKLQKYRQVINSSLNYWYRKKFFFHQWHRQPCHPRRHTRLYRVRLHKLCRQADNRGLYNQQDIEESFRALTAGEQMQQKLVQNINKYSPVEIVAITLASADMSLGGYYSLAISYMFATSTLPRYGHQVRGSSSRPMSSSIPYCKINRSSTDDIN